MQQIHDRKNEENNREMKVQNQKNIEWPHHQTSKDKLEYEKQYGT